MALGSNPWKHLQPYQREILRWLQRDERRSGFFRTSAPADPDALTFRQDADGIWRMAPWHGDTFYGFDFGQADGDRSVMTTVRRNPDGSFTVEKVEEI